MPAPDRPTIPEVLPLIKAYYREHPSGGSLHITLDDGNIERDHILFCKRSAEEDGDAAGVEIADLLLRMSTSQLRRLTRDYAYALG